MPTDAPITKRKTYVFKLEVSTGDEVTFVEALESAVEVITAKIADVRLQDSQLPPAERRQ